MKKYLITFVAVFCLLTTVKAQTLTGNYDGMYFGSIPGIFTQNGHPYLVAAWGAGRLSVFDGTLTALADVNNDRVITDAFFMDADASSITISGFHNTLDHDLLLTQNLFNDDGYFEFLEGQSTNPNASHCDIINIKSSNGTILQSIFSEEGWYFADSKTAFVLKIDGNFYLVFRESNYQEELTKHVFYLVKQNQGLTKVDVDLPLSVFPTIPTREQQITVELGEGNNATEIIVVNSLGQTVKRIPIEAGQREITIPAGELGSGLNVINARSPQGQGSCKIIVR